MKEALPFNRRLKLYARQLRKNMTDAEHRVWARVRRKQLKGCQFYRQKNIGDFIVDFYCPSAKLIVEIDGGQHFTEEGIRNDKVRDSYLARLGFTVLRFTDTEVFQNTDAVIERIWEYL